ncbi:hypothetical protein J6590_051097 [Homalodisca vitripennis]|nr:hypothetical protein J6590_051097 [Homalodisca vitripennis]
MNSLLRHLVTTVQVARGHEMRRSIQLWATFPKVEREHSRSPVECGFSRLRPLHCWSQ